MRQRAAVRPLVAAILLAASAAIAPVASGAGASAGTRSHRAHTANFPALRVEVVQTTASLSQRLRRLRDLTFRQGSPLGVPVIRVDDSVRAPRINGFGAAMTDTSAWLLHDVLSPANREMVMEALFGPAGLHLSLLRVPMAASDFTATGRPYSYDDLPAGQTDPQLRHFSIAHDSRYIVPVLRDALQLNPLAEVFATPWSAPPWMKANGQFGNTGNLGTLLPADYGAFAQYFVKFIQAYERDGIHVTAVTPENEPLSPAPYPAMQFPVQDEARWITQDLAPALRKARLSTRIYGFDGGWAPYPRSLIATAARRAIAGIAWHCYGGPTQMGGLHHLAPKLDQVVTECSPGLPPYQVAEVVISSVRSWASGVALWNVALNPAGGPVEQPNAGCRHCSGLITISEKTRKVGFTRAFFQLGQASRFVPPGAWRISTNHFVRYYRLATGGYGVTAGIDDVAFLDPDGTRVLVAYNTGKVPTSFGVKWRNSSFTYRLPAKATVTFVWKPQ